MRHHLIQSMLVASAVACASQRSATTNATPQRGAARFQHADQIQILPPASESPRPRSTNLMLRIPRRAQPNPGVDHVAIVFVVDTVGRVELPTISVIVAPRDAELVRSICDYLVNARFTQQPPAQRALLLQTFSFDMTRFAPALPFPFVADSTREQLRAMPRDELFASLEARPHCR